MSLRDNNIIGRVKNHSPIYLLYFIDPTKNQKL